MHKGAKNVRNNMGNAGLVELAFALALLVIFLLLFREQAVDFLQKLFSPLVCQ